MADRDSHSGEEDGQFGRLVVAIERLAAAVKEGVDQQGKPKGFFERNGTLIGLLSVVVTIALSAWQLDNSSGQFDRSLRENQFAGIVDGMASESVGVQVNSIRRLVQYVRDPGNFESTDAQDKAAVNTAQTLTAFIEDESGEPGREGLTDYRDPQPVVVSRAMGQLMGLAGTSKDDGSEDNEDEEGSTFPWLAIDLSRGNFHGVNAPDFAPEGSFLAVGADFRAAGLPGWDLTAVPAPVLGSAFFTCANLQNADFGTANVAGADFTGANLRAADLSRVQNLTSEQIRGALTGPLTKLPSDVVEPPQPGWGITGEGPPFSPTLRCRHLLDHMTDLLPGAGFSTRLPCPGAAPSRWKIQLSKREQSALSLVCRLRSKGQHFGEAAAKSAK